MIDVIREIPVTGPPPEPEEYPREGCPECKGPVECEILTCDLDEDHERWRCLDTACGEDRIPEDDLVTVHGPDEYVTEPTLDARQMLRAGRVMPSLVEWVKARVRL